jgi:type IV pilus assembly protein PilC
MSVTFDYVALDGVGVKIKGRAASASERELAAALRKDGLFLLKAEEERRAGPAAADRPLPAKVLSDFAERLEILTKAGIPLVEALRRIADDTDHVQAARVFDAVAAEVAAGRPFSEAIATFPRVFDATFRAVTAAGEASGSLDEVLAVLSVKLIRRAEAMKRMRGALAYPCGLLLALSGLFMIIVMVLIPRFSAVFEKAGVPSPPSTRAILACKDFLAANWMLLACGAAVVATGFAYGLRFVRFRRGAQAVVRKTPGIGAVVEMSEAQTFTHIVGLLNKYGVTLTRALEIAGDAAKTERVKDGIADVLASVTKGEGFADAVRKSGVLPPLVVQMVEVGERSGALDDALGRVESYFDREVPRAINKMLGMLGPLLTLVSGVAVGFAIFSVFQPLMSVLKALKG